MSQEKIKSLRYLFLICLGCLALEVILGIVAYHFHFMWLYLSVFVIAGIVTVVGIIRAPEMDDQGRIIKHDRD